MVRGVREVESCAHDLQIIRSSDLARANRRNTCPALTREGEMTLLTDDEIQERLIAHEMRDRPGWSYQQNILVKKFELDEFMDVVDLVNAVAEEAETIDHHPDMLTNYRRITFMLSPHNQGGITEKDFVLLDLIEHRATSLM
jgi:4a-hydroxytetrahydrobiopterin dehydratase